MNLCSLPTHWPYYKVQILIFLFLIGCVALLVSIAFARRYNRAPALLFQTGKFWRNFIRLHQTQFIKALTLSAAALPILMIPLQLLDSNRCYLWYTLIDEGQTCAAFLLIYLTLLICSNQGLPSFLGPNLRITWDRGDIMSLHLTGKPEEIVKLLDDNFPSQLDEIAKKLDSEGLPKTLRLESWLFFRPRENVNEKELVELRKLITCPNLTRRFAALAEKPANRVANIKRFLIRGALFFTLLSRANAIFKGLNRLDAPKRSNSEGEFEELTTTRSIQYVIKKLKQLDTGRHFINLPFRRMSVFEVIALITLYPTLASSLYPWCTGFQLSK